MREMSEELESKNGKEKKNERVREHERERERERAGERNDREVETALNSGHTECTET